MTKKLYHDNQYQTSFTARIIDRLDVNNTPAVILDQTAFYPTAGGQPHDTGTLQGIRVVEVKETETNQIVHLLAQPITDDRVEGQIDWTRRFDHMQQHTGQHLLSQALLTTHGVETISMHLGDESATIDVKQAGLTDEKIAAAEELANRIIYENRVVLTHWATKDEIHRFPLRKMPVVDENIRILEIKDFDFSPCGGTHCSRTGEIGIVKVRKWETYKGGSRIHFVCGSRAVRDYQRKTIILRQLSDALTSGEADLPAHLTKLQDEFKMLKRDHTDILKQRVVYEAHALIAERKPCGAYHVLTKSFDNRGANDLKLLAAAVLEQTTDTVVLFGGRSEGKVSLLFARSDTLPFDMNALLKMACGVVNGRGGGQPQQAQGGGTAVEKMEEALHQAEKTLLDVTPLKKT